MPEREVLPRPAFALARHSQIQSLIINAHCTTLIEAFNFFRLPSASETFAFTPSFPGPQTIKIAIQAQIVCSPHSLTQLIIMLHHIHATSEGFGAKAQCYAQHAKPVSNLVLVQVKLVTRIELQSIPVPQSQLL